MPRKRVTNKEFQHQRLKEQGYYHQGHHFANESDHSSDNSSSNQENQVPTMPSTRKSVKANQKVNDSNKKRDQQLREIAGKPQDDSEKAYLKLRADENKRSVDEFAREYVKANGKSLKGDEGKSSTLMSAISRGVKEYLYPRIKFITNENIMKKCAKKVLDFQNWETYKGNDDYTKSAREHWIKVFAQLIKQVLNNHRNMVQTSVKNVCKTYIASNNGKLPSNEDLLKCINRAFPIRQDDGVDVFTNEADQKLFQWYWEKLLPAASGNPRDWGVHHSHYGCISSMTPINEPDSPFITPTTEAIAICLVEGNKAKWEATHEVMQRPEYQGKNFKHHYVQYHPDNPTVLLEDETVSSTPTRAIDSFYFAPYTDTFCHLFFFFGTFSSLLQVFVGNGTTRTSKDPKTVYMGGAVFRSPYTDSMAGQSEYHAWTQEGLDRYNELSALVKDNRSKQTKRNAIDRVEKTMLRIIREENHREQATYEEEKKANKRQRTNGDAAVAVAVVNVEANNDLTDTDSEVEEV